MALDLRANQLRNNKIIASGSTGTPASLLVYGVGGASDSQGTINTAVFPTGSIGTDTFLYVSGGTNILNTAYAGASVFAGDLYVSGNFFTAGTHTNGATFFFASGTTVNANGTVLYSASIGANITSEVWITVLAKTTPNTSDRGRWYREGFYYRSASNNVTQFDSIIIPLQDMKSANSWDVNMTPSGTFIIISVTGSTSSSVNWSISGESITI